LRLKRENDGFRAENTRLSTLAESIKADYLKTAKENERLEREIADYKKAKAENDERYMTERDEARRELAAMTERAEKAEAELSLAKNAWMTLLCQMDCSANNCTIKDGFCDSVKDDFENAMRIEREKGTHDAG
jgi:polyphosphate kinase 2 (PPK2 family)